MLQTAKMGRGSERVGAESSNSAPVGRLSSGPQVDLRKSSMLPRDGTPHIQPKQVPHTNGTPSILPMKRSHEESERGYDRARTPPREPLNRVAMSPPNLRQAFVPDRGDHWSPNRDNRQSGGSLSPVATRRDDVGDRWVPPSRRSPPLNSPTALRRPSLLSDGSSEYFVWSKPMSKSSPPRPPQPDILRTNSDHRERQTFKNLSWKAPDADLRRQIDPGLTKADKNDIDGSSRVPEFVADRVNKDIERAKVDYNGLKDVPTGPKQAPAIPPTERSRVSSRSLPPVKLSVQRSPHIFISQVHVPTLSHITKHLHRFLRKYVPRESDIFLDDLGWYITFEDTAAGRERLHSCCKKQDRAKFFNTYDIIMEPFPKGQPLQNQNSDTSPDGGVSSKTVKATYKAPSIDATANAQALPEDLHGSLQVERRLKHKGSAADDFELSMLQPRTSPLLSEKLTQSLRHSSPLRVQSLQDRDETSSAISGMTGSDISASRRLKCHICQTSALSDSDTLVRCSTCPRRYHRRCHIQPAISTDLDHDHTWQCRRCVKKEVQPKSRLSNASPAVEYSPAASVGQAEEPPLKRLRQDVSPSSLLRSQGVIADDSTVIYSNDADGATIHQDTSREDEHLDTEDSYEPLEGLTSNSDEKHLSEANDLVAKSFATSLANHETHPRSASKYSSLNLVRKRVNRDEALARIGSVDSLEQIRGSANSTPKSTTDRSEPGMPPVELVRESDTPKSQRKFHKWTGGGADKDIIQAGRSHFFPEHHSPVQGVASAPVSKAPLDKSLVNRVEVPESPEEMKTSCTDVHAHALEASRKEKSIHVSSEDSFETAAQIAHANPAAESLMKPSAGTVQRMKPGAPALMQCIKCQRTIAYRPSGANKLCSRCMKEAVVEADHHYIESTAAHPRDTDHQPSLAIQEAEVIDTPAPTKTASSLVSNNDIRIDEQSEGTTPTVLARKKPARPRTACEKCRKNRHRCIHNPDSLSKSSTAKPAEGFAAINTQEQGDGSEDDPLDLWRAKSKLKPAIIATHESVSTEEAFQNDIEATADTDAPKSQGEESRQSTPDEPLDQDAPLSAQAKRQSQTRPATGAHDLGDSYSRPANTYQKLIGMALTSAPGHRLRGTEIVQWVINNISSYEAGKGSWENGLRATMTLKKEGYQGGKGIWKVVDDGAKRNQGFMYQMLPGEAEGMLQWDPVLKQPVSPPRGWRIEHEDPSDRDEAEASHSYSPQHDRRESPAKSRGTRRKRGSGRTENRPPKIRRPEGLHIDTTEALLPMATEEVRSIESVSDSSEDEPLARIRRKTGTEPTVALIVAGTTSPEQNLEDLMNIDPALSEAEIARRPSASPSDGRRAIAKTRIVPSNFCKPTLAELIEMDAKNIDYSAKSLFDEWPEYDPKHEFDREAKIAEIKQRPTRKQRFGKQVSLAEMGPRGMVTRYVFPRNSLSLNRPRRPIRTTVDPWEVGEENVVLCDSVEELFNLPNNPMAIVQDGQLIGYRDGTLNDDGVLPRAKVIYKTGYA